MLKIFLRCMSSKENISHILSKLVNFILSRSFKFFTLISVSQFDQGDQFLKHDSPPVGNHKRHTTHGVTWPSITCPGWGVVTQSWTGGTPVLDGGYPSPEWGTAQSCLGGTWDQSLGYPQKERTWDQWWEVWLGGDGGTPYLKRHTHLWKHNLPSYLVRGL